MNSNVTRLEKTCPKCGSHLIMKEGEHGDFLACPKFPACRHTEPLPEGSWSKGDHGTLLLSLRKTPSPYCEKCNHTGLLPFMKGDRIIPNVMLDCECKIREDKREHYSELKPDDFDFPCSDTFRGYYHEQYGNAHDQMIERDFKQPKPVVAKEPVSQPWDKRQNYQIDQMRAELMNIKHKLAEMTKPKPQQQPQKSTYKGLVVKDGN